MTFVQGEAETGQPINEALRRVGVLAEANDEFDALGLGRFRDMSAFHGG